MIVGLSIAEGVSAYPVAGGAYQIINRILGGRLRAWLADRWAARSPPTSPRWRPRPYGGTPPFIANWFGVDLYGPLGRPSPGLFSVAIALSTLLNLVAVKIAAAFNNSVGVIAEVVAIAISVVGGLVIALLFGNSHFFHSLELPRCAHRGRRPGRPSRCCGRSCSRCSCRCS